MLAYYNSNFPRTVIFARFNIFKKIFDFFENIMSTIEEKEETLKNGLFY